MDKRIMLLFTGVIIVLISTSLANAVIFDVQKAREKELVRYEEYKTDYIQTNDLEAFSKYIDERGLMNSFGFRPASYYYIPPDVLQAKYNPPLQGVAYSTANRDSTSSLYQPSAVKYYGEQVNGRYTGFIPSTSGGLYFDHPQMNGESNSANSNSYGYASYGNYGYGNYGNYNYDAYSSSSDDSYTQGYYNLYPYSQGSYIYDSHYQNNVYGNYNPYYSNQYYSNSLDFESFEEPRYYSRMVEPLTGGFYIVGYY
jgi:hypothetical protein